MSVFAETWRLIELSAPFILFGFSIAGLIHALIPAEKVVSLLGKRGWRSVLLASICGIPLPLCSCSVLPTAAALRKKGANKGATASFLVSTPETGIDSIAMTYAMIDFPVAILRVVSAFVTAMVTGCTVNMWGGKEKTEPDESSPSCCSHNNGNQSCCHTTAKPSWWKSTIQYAFIDLFSDLALWLALGFILSGIISAWLPDTVFEGRLGGGLPGILLMLVVSIPMYICATGSTPIAAALIAKGLSPGAALVFLLAGPATNTAAIPVLSRLLGKRSVVLYLISVIGTTLLIALLVDYFYLKMGLSIVPAIVTPEHEHISIVNRLTGILFVALLFKGMWKKSVPSGLKKLAKGLRSNTGF